jgi:hypothetical protein
MAMFSTTIGVSWTEHGLSEEGNFADKLKIFMFLRQSQGRGSGWGREAGGPKHHTFALSRGINQCKIMI